MMITASSAVSSIRMKTRCHGDPFTFTDRPFARASAMMDFFFRSTVSVLLPSPAWSSSASSSAATRPSEAKVGSRSPLGSETFDESMKVAETEVISRTDRDKGGVHGRIECQPAFPFEVSVNIVNVLF